MQPVWTKIQDGGHPQIKSLKMATTNILQCKVIFFHKFSKWQRIYSANVKDLFVFDRCHSNGQAQLACWKMMA